MDILEDYIGPEDDEDEDTDSQDEDKESEDESEDKESGDKDDDKSSDDSDEDKDDSDDSDKEDEDEDEDSDEPEDIDVSKVSDDNLYEDERVKRLVQSERDKAIDSERKKAQTDTRKAREAAQRKRDQDEDDALLESEDYEGYGKRMSVKRKAEQEEVEASKRYDLALFEDLQVRFADLGAEKIEEVIRDLESKGTLSIVNLVDAFSDARAEKFAAKVSKKAKADEDDEDEADETEARAKKRSGKKKASADVSGSRKAKPVKKATTDDELIDQYNEGDLAFDELPENVQKRVE